MPTAGIQKQMKSQELKMAGRQQRIVRSKSGQEARQEADRPGCKTRRGQDRKQTRNGQAMRQDKKRTGQEADKKRNGQEADKKQTG